MTDHPRTPPGDVEALRHQFAQAAPSIVANPDAVVRRARRRRAWVRAGTSAGVIAVMLVAVLVVRPWGGAPGPAATLPPPSEPSREVEIQVVPEAVAPGEVVTVVLIANADNGLTFGVAAQL
ncbi:hypothetical protein, partial [Demequina sp.]|uniref:hypothetical protein n=1 Tax=Demequina sp. TaxID=2050685 RepID=UPI0025C5AB77